MTRTVFFPSPLLAGIVVFPTLLSLGLFWATQLSWVVMGLDLALVALAALDLAISSRGPVEAVRDYRDTFSVGRPSPLDVVLTWHGKYAVDALLRANLPARASSPDFPLSVRLDSQEPARVRYHVIADERGSAVLGDHFVRFASRLGLWTFEARCTANDPVRIYPDLATVRSYELLARRHRQYALVRSSALRGGESEFARLREYTTDDDYRFVDWKATARRGKLTSREYQLESDQNIMLVLDAGRLMTAEVDGLSQFDHALNASLLMTHVASRGGDRVGMLCFDEEVRAFVLPHGGPKTTHRITRATYALHPRITDSAFGPGLAPIHDRLKQRSLIVLFTQLLDDTAALELAEQLRLLTRKHLALVVVLDDAEFARRIHAPAKQLSRLDLYEKGAVAELLLWRAEALNLLKRSGALVIEASARELTPRLINRYLELKARRSL